MDDDFTTTLDLALNQVRSREDARSLARRLMRLAETMMDRAFAPDREDGPEYESDYDNRRERCDGERQCGSHCPFM
jgi:hypothetical protein